MTSLAIGQLWTCKDLRRAGRTLRVAAFDDENVHAVVVTNRQDVQALVDAGRTDLDRRGQHTTILRRRFAADCYRLVAHAPQNTPGDTVVRLPQTCTDYGTHKWLPIQILGVQGRPSIVRLVCTKCYGHTQRVSPYLANAAVVSGDFAA
ncbi:hypothetical protein [Streptomyces sp. WZ-12]|uniref:hypothetical protein n=1 Tax=Streptomyces sp. WZ-12 TaxID=3030210 RepID=UPI002380C96E|nr:hypothetical protein [Streptomyces sp. WZ-12]